MTVEEITKELVEVRREFGDLRAEVASAKSIEDIVKYLLYFWLSLSAILGLVGWKQISDVDTTIANAVTKQFPRDSEQFRQYASLIDETKKLHKDFEDLTKTYKERVDDLKYADVVASDFDIEGQVVTLVLESNDHSNLIDQEWRTKAIGVLGKLRTSLATKAFPADFIFNAAQVCRQLNQFQLAEEMTGAAFAKDPWAPIKALKLSSEVANKTGPARLAAFGELMKMVENLDYEASPHIVLAEAWNAAETSRNYGPLLDAIDRNLHRPGSPQVPSYLYTIRAQALLRRSRPGDLESARDSLAKGRMLFVAESPLSQWNEEFARDYVKLSRQVNESRDVVLEQATEESGSEGAQQLEMLKRLLESVRPDDTL